MPADVRCELSPPAGSPYRRIVVEVQGERFGVPPGTLAVVMLSFVGTGTHDLRTAHLTAARMRKFARDLLGFANEMDVERDREAVAEMRRQLGEFDAEEGE